MRKFVTWLVVIAVLLLGLDFGARVIAEREIATQLQKRGFPDKPSVSIAGFPFLPQAISRNIHQVTISSSDVPAGPVTITKVTAVLTGVHINSGYNGATVDHVHGTAFISFGALDRAVTAQAGGLAGVLVGGGLKLVPAGSHEVRASLNLLVETASATWRVVRLGGREIRVQLVSSSGLPSALLNSVANIDIPLSKLPIGLRVTSLVVTPAGVTGQLTGTNLTFGG